MAVNFKPSRFPTLVPGVSAQIVTADVPAGADQSVAIVWPRAYAAAPRVTAPVRVDNNAIDVACVPSITAITATGCTLRQKGTSTVIMTYDFTVVGDLNNATAY